MYRSQQSTFDLNKQFEFYIYYKYSCAAHLLYLYKKYYALYLIFIICIFWIDIQINKLAFEEYKKRFDSKL